MQKNGIIYWKDIRVCVYYSDSPLSPECTIVVTIPYKLNVDYLVDSRFTHGHMLDLITTAFLEKCKHISGGKELNVKVAKDRAFFGSCKEESILTVEFDMDDYETQNFFRENFQREYNE